MEPIIVLSRKAAFKVAWRMFWFATGTKRVGLMVNSTKNEIVLVGDALVED